MSGLNEKEKLEAYGTKAKHARSKSNAAGIGSAHKEHDFAFGKHAQDNLYMGAGMGHGLNSGALGNSSMGMIEQFEQYGAAGFAVVFAVVILVAYLWQWCKSYYQQANKSFPDEIPNQNRGFVPLNPPTPRTKAMMEADPDFNPNNVEHRVMTLEALDRTSR